MHIYTYMHIYRYIEDLIIYEAINYIEVARCIILYSIYINLVIMENLSGITAKSDCQDSN